MRNAILALALIALTLNQTGCATGFRASGPRGGGVSAGAGIGTTATPVYVQPSVETPPPPSPGPLR